MLRDKQYSLFYIKVTVFVCLCMCVHLFILNQ